MDVFVTGGAGTLGRALVPRLIANGHRVTVASRHPRSIEGSDTAVVDLATGIGLDALAGHDVVVHLATDPFDSNADIDGTARLIDGAARHGVRHLVAISIVGIDDHPWPYYRVKLAQEKLITEGRVPWTLLRATQFHDLVPRFIREMPAIGLVPVPVGLRLQPIDVADVAERLAQLVEAGPAGRVDDLGGPEVLAGRKMVKETLHGLGLHRLVVPLPLFGAIGQAFGDGRMLTEPHSDGRRWSEWVKQLTPMRDAVGRVSMLSAGLLMVTAAIMILAPDWFHSEVAPFGEPNAHFVRDTATFMLPVMIGLWLTADRRAWRRPVFAIVAIQNGAHLINHLFDLGTGWLGFANVASLGVLELAVLWMWRASKPAKATTAQTTPTPAVA
jgi:uncharacterized protein YbjT (DUF2867 family)